MALLNPLCTRAHYITFDSPLLYHEDSHQRECRPTANMFALITKETPLEKNQLWTALSFGKGESTPNYCRGISDSVLFMPTFREICPLKDWDLEELKKDSNPDLGLILVMWR